MKTKLKPYSILWWSIPLTCIVLLLARGGAFDMQLHDTYVVMGSLHLAIVFFFFLGILGGAYWLLRNYKMLFSLSMIHSVFTSAMVVGISIMCLIQSKHRTMNLELFSEMNSIAMFLLAALIFVKLIFIVNVVIGVVRGQK